MRSVRYHAEARAEFLHEIEYYAAISPGLAERYEQAVQAAASHAASSPDAWPKYRHKTRRVVERRFKFSLVYLHTAGEIVVVAIAPSQRRPGYWKDRLGGV